METHEETLARIEEARLRVVKEQTIQHKVIEVIVRLLHEDIAGNIMAVYNDDTDIPNSLLEKGVLQFAAELARRNNIDVSTLVLIKWTNLHQQSNSGDQEQSQSTATPHAVDPRSDERE
jgi:hypothetical protein